MFFTTGIAYAVCTGIMLAVVERYTRNQTLRNVAWGMAIVGAFTIGVM